MWIQKHKQNCIKQTLLMKIRGHVARVGLNINVYRGLVGKSLGTWSVGIPRRRREQNVKVVLRKID
jgi:hypothetical protein